MLGGIIMKFRDLQSENYYLNHREIIFSSHKSNDYSKNLVVYQKYCSNRILVIS